MKKFGTFFLLGISILISSCDKCNEGDKATPASVFVEIIDETSSENVFENETFTSQQISIKDLNDVDIPFNFISNTNFFYYLLPNRTSVEMIWEYAPFPMPGSLKP